MAIESAALIVQCQVALQLTQQELADRPGKNRRTIQRWQNKGVAMSMAEAEALAELVRPVRPDLADQVLEVGRQSAARAGIVLPRGPASKEQIGTILEAAAKAGGNAIRAAVVAAFEKAGEMGVEVDAVIEGLGEP